MVSIRRQEDLQRCEILKGTRREVGLRPGNLIQYLTRNLVRPERKLYFYFLDESRVKYLGERARRGSTETSFQGVLRNISAWKRVKIRVLCHDNVVLFWKSYIVMVIHFWTHWNILSYMFRFFRLRVKQMQPDVLKTQSLLELFIINTYFLPSGDSSCTYVPVRYLCTSADLPLARLPTMPCSRGTGCVRFEYLK